MEQITDIQQYKDEQKKETLLQSLEASNQDTSGLVIKILEDEVAIALEKDKHEFYGYYDFLLGFCTEIVNRTRVRGDVQRLVDILNDIKHDEYVTIIDDYDPQGEDIRFSVLIEHCGKDSKIVANQLKKFIYYGSSLFARECALETVGKYRIQGLKETIISYINQRSARVAFYTNRCELEAAQIALNQLEEDNQIAGVF